jgi:hypothetical protein
VKIAQAKFKADRDLSTKGVSKTEREKQVATVGADTEKLLSRKEAVRDTGLGSYEPLDERQARRQRREEVRTGSGTDTDTQPPKTTTTRRKPRRIIIDSDEEPESGMEVDSTQEESESSIEMDSTQPAPTTVPQQTITPQQSMDTT